MTVSEMAEKMGLNMMAGSGGADREISGCYIGDLMSLAMAHLSEANVWITIQTNMNMVAVASLKEAACVILADGAVPDGDAARKADQEEIPILTAPYSAYTLALRLGALEI